MLIQGQVIIEADIESFSGATLNIYLQDVSRMDAPARIVHEQILPNISHNKGQPTHLGFSMDVDDTDDARHPRYNLRAHLDKSGSGEVDKDDLVTTRSYPVNLQEDPRDYELGRQRGVD
ncbi:MAG: YbaY family lipoprotein [Balneolaceae bacterium]|nr:YbaY family lipoprotein [Balneolaceae bacterium]